MSAAVDVRNSLAVRPLTPKLAVCKVDATGYVTEAERLGESGVFDTKTRKWSLVGGVSHPVTQVSWNDALAPPFSRSAGSAPSKGS